MMRRRAPRRDQIATHPHGHEEIGNSAHVHVTNFSRSDAELHAAESMRAHLDAIPVAQDRRKHRTEICGGQTCPPKE